MAQITDLNSPSADFLSGLHFDFALQRCPGVNFFCTKATVPGISIGNPDLPTPFKTIPLPADKLSFEELDITFKVDAMMSNWLELYTWFTGVGFPRSFGQRAVAEPSGKVRDLYSDASLIIQDYHKNPILSIQFTDMLPVRLSGIMLDVTAQDVDYIEAQCTFKYREYTVTQLKTTY